MVLRNMLLENKIEFGVMVFVKEGIIDQREKKLRAYTKINLRHIHIAFPILC